MAADDFKNSQEDQHIHPRRRNPSRRAARSQTTKRHPPDRRQGLRVEFPDKVTITASLREDYSRIPKPYYENIFYYSQVGLLTSLSKGKSWTFSKIRPGVIVGFVPGTNFINAAQGLGLYLSLYRAVHGEGAHVPFPGSQRG
jgi:hypothetical protein